MMMEAHSTCCRFAPPGSSARKEGAPKMGGYPTASSAKGGLDDLKPWHMRGLLNGKQ